MGTKKRVLIVDDEPNLRLLYETEFRRAGFEAVSAPDARQGLECVGTLRPDLVVLDIRMPGMDGVEALQRLFDRDRTIPVVLNTSYGSYARNFLTWVADAFVTKSSDVTELLATVSGLLGRQPAGQATATRRSTRRVATAVAGGAIRGKTTGRRPRRCLPARPRQARRTSPRAAPPDRRPGRSR